MHSTSYHDYNTLFEILLLQSVPIFLILMGTVGAMSFNRSGKIDYITYFLKRVRRLVVPLIPIFFVTILISIVYGKQMYIGWANLVGEMPLSGPGSYFIYLALAGIFIVPALWEISQRTSMTLMLAMSFLISLNIELFPQPGLVAMIFRNLFFFAIGICLAEIVTRNEMPRWLLIVICSSIIFVGVLAITQYPLFDIETLYGNCLTAFFTVGIIITIMSLNLSLTPIDLLGKASWHLFLTQMIVLLIFNHGLFLNLLVVIPLGLGFYYLDAIIQSGKISFFNKIVKQ